MKAKLAIVWLCVLIGWLAFRPSLPDVEYHSWVFEPPMLEARTLESLHSVSAYCHCRVCCGQWADRFTASGKRVERGMVAADPSVWPLGTCLEVESIGRVVVEDTGSAILGKRLDVYMPSHWEALQFGRQELRVSEC